jgi:hypothetical protein
VADNTDDASPPTAITVGTSAQLLLAATPGNRRALIIANAHASNTLYLGFGSDADDVTTANGIPVPAGGSYTDEQPNCFSGAIWGIASGAGTSVRLVTF